ncbi:MAG TPA: hypothetical protein VF584_24235 [Longimicrobium sp.]|jgi:hypothetical protein
MLTSDPRGHLQQGSGCAGKEPPPDGRVALDGLPLPEGERTRLREDGGADSELPDVVERGMDPQLARVFLRPSGSQCDGLGDHADAVHVGNCSRLGHAAGAGDQGLEEAVAGVTGRQV